MLDAFIIEQLKRKREEKQWEPIPLELPVPDSTQQRPEQADDGERDDRGVVIIDNDGMVAKL